MSMKWHVRMVYTTCCRKKNIYKENKMFGVDFKKEPQEKKACPPPSKSHTRPLSNHAAWLTRKGREQVFTSLAKHLVPTTLARCLWWVSGQRGLFESGSPLIK